jgi:hypothetical protein
MKTILSLIITIFCTITYAQLSEPLAMNVKPDKPDISDTTKKLFSNSVAPGISFLVSSNLRDNKLYITTNFSGRYKIRFIDYYARTKKVYKDAYSDFSIDLDEFDKSIFIMNIVDSRNNKLLTSQVINLKRRHL